MLIRVRYPHTNRIAAAEGVTRAIRPIGKDVAMLTVCATCQKTIPGHGSCPHCLHGSGPAQS